MSDTNAVETSGHYGTGQKRLSVYTLGIILCVILTLIPFFTVITKKYDHSTTLLIIFVSALLQFLTQVVCFLRLNTKTDQGKTNVMAFVFTIVVLLVVVGGSLWIMWSLRSRMM